MIRFIAIAGATLLALAAYVYLAGRVDDAVSAEDLGAIEAVFGHIDCGGRGDFEREYACIKGMQGALKVRVPSMKCADRGVPIEPASFLARGYGCCFDRARLLEKALATKGFKTRHLALYDSSRYGALAIAVPGVESHATLEVLTAKGWMGVDSNENFVLITRERQPLVYRDLPARLDEVTENVQPRALFRKPMLGVYGLHSRHGYFHGINAPAPELNYVQFFEHHF